MFCLHLITYIFNRLPKFQIHSLPPSKKKLMEIWRKSQAKYRWRVRRRTVCHYKVRGQTICGANCCHKNGGSAGKLHEATGNEKWFCLAQQNRLYFLWRTWSCLWNITTSERQSVLYPVQIQLADVSSSLELIDLLIHACSQFIYYESCLFMYCWLNSKKWIIIQTCSYVMLFLFSLLADLIEMNFDTLTCSNKNIFH